MKAKDAGRKVAIAVLLAVAAGACGGSGDGDDQGGSNGQGQNQRGAAVEVLPASSFDPGPDGGADLPEPTFLIVVKECYAALRARSFDVLAPRMTAIIESADAGTDRGVVVAARLCRGLANLNDGALEAATRDLDSAEGGLGALPGDPKHQLELLLLRGQMVASAGQQRLDEAGAYLARAAALAPGQAAQLEQELAAASGASPATTEPATTSPPTTTPATTGSSGTSTTAPATSVTIG
ncbi:MAG: hypothetical protein K0S88_4568 [Actinomycetia bacterium]|nr:hypothetical protein [Actinomycetes bacterium]